MTYTIQRLSDHHNCETCGYSGADGYQIYKEGVLLIDKQPYADCYDSISYPHDGAYYDIFELEHIDVKEYQAYFEEDSDE